MRLSELFSETKVLPVAIGDSELSVTYRPQAITPEMMDRMTTAANAPGEAIVKTVVDLVVAWDLTDDSSAPYPVTLDNVRKLPVSFLATITKAITEDINPNALMRNSSRAT